MCREGRWGACEGGIGPRARNCQSAEDADCDGLPDNHLDETCRCAATMTEVCDSHPGRDGFGTCQAGHRNCVVAADTASSQFGECLDARGPSLRDCNSSLDNDCDGFADNTLDGVCQCAPQTRRGCREADAPACGALVAPCELSLDRSSAHFGACVLDTLGALSGTHLCEDGAPTTVFDRCSEGGCRGVTALGRMAAEGVATCAVEPSGRVYCWGALAEGGGGVLPSPVAGVTEAIAVAGSALHRCVLLASGRVLCAGANGYGQLGDGTVVAHPTLVPVLGEEGVTELAIGQAHSCALHNDGSVHCWGINNLGQLGTGDFINRSTASDVPNLPPVVELRAGAHHTCARTTEGQLYCWGNNASGQLGDGGVESQPRATRVTVLDSVLAPLPADAGPSAPAQAQSVAAGGDHSCAVLQGGDVYCFGDNSFGQLGNATTVSSLSAVLVVGFGALDPPASVVAGRAGSCALSRTGRLLCWGLSHLSPSAAPGQPGRIPGLERAASVSVGFEHACAVSEAGQIWCWGSNVNAALGDGTYNDRAGAGRVRGLSW
jgi:hypothetical protein